MKNIISFLFILIIISICTGFYYKSFDEELGNKIIGFSMLFMVFVFMYDYALLSYLLWLFMF